MKLWQSFAIAALFSSVAMNGMAQVPEQAPSDAHIDVCTSDRVMTYMYMKTDAPPEEITYGLWGQLVDDLRETVEHFTINQLRNDDDLLMAALDSFGLKFKLKYGFNIQGGPDGTPPHACQEPPRTTPLPELYVGQIDACIADKSMTVSVIYGIVTNATPEFRKSLTAAIGRTVSRYDGDMTKPDNLKEAITNTVLAVEKEHGGESFFYFAPSGALQQGCKPLERAL